MLRLFAKNPGTLEASRHQNFRVASEAGVLSVRTHPVRHSVAEEPSPATPIAKCTRARPPPNRRSRPNCDIGSGVVALVELQQLLRTGEITARLNQVSETRRLK